MFNKVFGTGKEKIKKNCIILPANDRNLFNSLNIKSISRGMFYNVALTDNCSLISLKYRFFAGDCILMLNETLCENIFLFGSCGGLKGEVGEKVVVEKSLNLESFSRFLNTDDLKNFNFYYPDKKLLENFLSFIGYNDFAVYTSATVSSLVLEEKLSDFAIDCVDMESSMVFSAAAEVKRKAIALFYVTDVVGKLNFYNRYDRETREKIKGSRKSIAEKLIKFIDELS